MGTFTNTYNGIYRAYLNPDDSMSLSWSSGRSQYSRYSGAITSVRIKSTSSAIRASSGNAAQTVYLGFYFGDHKLGETSVYVNKGGGSYTSVDCTLSINSSLLTNQDLTSLSIWNSDGSGCAVEVTSSADWTVTFTYQDVTAPSTPYGLRLSPTSGPSGTTTTLSWTAPSNGGSAITRYRIYQNDSYLTDSTTTSKQIQITGNANTTVRLAVSAVNSVGESGRSSSVNFSITIATTAPTPPSSVLLNGHTAVYTGSQNTPNSLTLSWSGATPGTNNAIQGYDVKKDGTVIHSVGNVSSQAVSDIGTYTVVTRGAASNSTDSTSVVWDTIAAPATPTAVVSGPAKTNLNFTISWTEPVKGIGVDSLQYVIQSKIDTGEYTELTTVNTASYTYDITQVPVGSSVSFRIYTRAQAQDGGYTDSTTYRETTATSRFGNMAAPTISFSECYDPDSTVNKVTLQSYAYTRLTFTWNTTASASGDPVTYRPKYKITGGSWTYITVPTNSMTATIDVTDIAEGSSIAISVDASDGSSTAQYADRTITRLRRPELTNITCAANAYMRATAGFTWGFNNNTNVNINYTIDLKYDTQTVSTTNGLLNTASQPIVTHTLDTPLDVDTAIYQAVITQKNPEPAGNCTVTLMIENYPRCTTTSSVNFNYNYLHDITSLAAPAIQNLKSYYNPADIITYSFSPVNWTDAAGTTNGGDISYTLAAGNNIVENARPNEEYSSSYGATATTDTNYNITVTVTIKYSNGRTQTRSSTSTARIARWTRDYFALQQVKQNGNTVTGFLLLPSTYPCASSTYSNFKSIEYELLNLDSGTSYYTTIETTIVDPLLSFSFETSDTSFTIYAKITCTNTSGETLEIITANYVLYSSAASLALRKGRVGINTNNRFTKDSGNSALEIHDNGASATDGTVNIITTTEANKRFIDLTSGTEVIGNLSHILLNQKDGIAANGLLYIQTIDLSSQYDSFVGGQWYTWDIIDTNVDDYDDYLNLITFPSSEDIEEESFTNNFTAITINKTESTIQLSAYCVDDVVSAAPDKFTAIISTYAIK